MEFNDPFDCFAVIDFEGTQEEKEAWAAACAPALGISVAEAVTMVETALAIPEARAEFLEWRSNLASVGVLSLTERPDDMLMWAHYANSHKGYCLEFDATILPLSLAYRVAYAKQRPTFRIFDPDRNDLIARTLLHKADFWAHECEWRMVHPIAFGPIEFPPQALKAIILGVGTLQADEDELRAIVAERAAPVAFKRTRLNEQNYRVDIEDA
ncbi:MAG: DUF2971 domain-containing protein [Sphingopyxis sp.]|nr:DUF2971 domain-containing protein [Sphingopyxis sp.]